MNKTLHTLAEEARRRSKAAQARVPASEMAAKAEAATKAQLEEAREDGLVGFDGEPFFAQPFYHALMTPGTEILVSADAGASENNRLKDALERALAAVRGGAAAITCTVDAAAAPGTDEAFFEVTDTVAAPVLREDMVVDAYGMDEAKVLGAAAVRVAMPPEGAEALQALLGRAEALGLDALVEVSSAEGAEAAREAGATLVAVDVRPCADEGVRASLVQNVRSVLPPGTVLVVWSDSADPQSFARLAGVGADAVGFLGTEPATQALEDAVGACHLAADATVTAPSWLTPSLRAPFSPADTQPGPGGSTGPGAPGAAPAASSGPAAFIEGIASPEPLGVVNADVPQYIGFTLIAGAPDAVTAQEAAELREQTAPPVNTVGVFAGADPAVIAKLAAEGVLSVALLQGSENEAYLAKLAELAPQLEVWQAFALRGKDDVARANASAADFVIVDLPAGEGAGQAQDWSLLDALARPYGIRGNLDAANVAAALANTQAVLVASRAGLEPKEIAAFIGAVRGEGSEK